MREILFRGKRVDNGKWAYGSLITDGEDVYVLPKENLLKGLDIGGWIDGVESYEVIPKTVGQYTGLKDLHGTRIFEKDIVRIYYPFDDPDDCVVSWSKEGARWDFGGCDAYFCTPSKNCEVIGNVYDDVNLLET